MNTSRLDVLTDNAKLYHLALQTIAYFCQKSNIQFSLLTTNLALAFSVFIGHWNTTTNVVRTDASGVHSGCFFARSNTCCMFNQYTSTNRCTVRLLIVRMRVRTPRAIACFDLYLFFVALNVAS